MANERESKTFLARLCEQAERYDEMVNYMKEVAKLGGELTVDERNLLSVAYKNVIGARRASWRTLNAESQDEKNSSLIEKYKGQVEEELKQICNNVLDLLKNSLIDQTVIDGIHSKGTSDS